MLIVHINFASLPNGHWVTFITILGVRKSTGKLDSSTVDFPITDFTFLCRKLRFSIWPGILFHL